MTYCEDYPCCGHTLSDPCAPQWYDAPGAFDVTRNPHALCDHEAGMCDVWEDDDFYDAGDCEHDGGNYTFLYTGNVRCDDCYDEIGTWTEGEDGPEIVRNDELILDITHL